MGMNKLLKVFGGEKNKCKYDSTSGGNVESALLGGP